MNYKSIFSVLLAFLFAAPLFAQNEEDKLIFDAMKDELNRSKQDLQLEDYGKAFYIEYTLNRTSQRNIRASLGTITNSYTQPLTNLSTVRLMLGDYKSTSDPGYNNNVVSGSMNMDVNYDAIRRSFWLFTDLAYKTALQHGAYKANYLRSNPRSAEEKDLTDFYPCKVTNSITSEKQDTTFDEAKWKRNLEELSAIFNAYPSLYNTSVTFYDGTNAIYKTTTEDLELKDVLNYTAITVVANVRTVEGIELGDRMSISGRTLSDFPSLDEMKSKIKAFADNLVALRDAAPMEEYYSGPVMFQEGAVNSLLMGNFFAPGTLTAFRPQEGKKAENSFDSRMGRKVLDSRFSVINYTNKTSYNGKPLFGHYKVDAEGVTPNDELVLIENGLFKSQLNGRIPTVKTPASTGSSRFAVEKGMPLLFTAPATIHFQVKNGLKEDKMKKQLIKAAQEEGLDHAYIVKKLAGLSSIIYKVDVKTGTETQVRAGNMTAINTIQLKRMNAISAKEQIENSPMGGNQICSIICPESFIINDVEFNNSKPQIEKAPAFVHPLERK